MNHCDCVGKVNSIKKDKLLQFILRCQDTIHGGLSDRPNDEVDVYHTFFGITGLNMLGYFSEHRIYSPWLWCIDIPYKPIDPTYALPTFIVEKLGLHPQRIEEH